MGKKYHPNGRSKTSSFVMLRYDMIESLAWKSLSAPAQALWCHIRYRYRPENNGEIPLSCREASKLLNISKNSAGRAFDELIEKGFIRVGIDSSFNLKTKAARRWIMTHEKLKNGQAETNEWREWKPA